MKTSIYLIVFVIMTIHISNLNAQSTLKGNIYVSPGAFFGYTFTTHGICCGISCDLGLFQYPIHDIPINYGISISKYLTIVKFRFGNRNHWHNTISAMAESSYFDLKVGYGRTYYRWGYGKRNKCSVDGVNIDLSTTTKTLGTPWIGFNTFRYKAANWAWYSDPYNSLYIKYKYDFGQSGLKEPIEKFK